MILLCKFFCCYSFFYYFHSFQVYTRAIKLFSPISNYATIRIINWRYKMSISSCGMNMSCGCQGDQSIFKMLAILSALTLIGAFGWEYYTDLKPCILCVYERYPYGVALLVSLFALWRNQKCSTKMALAALTVTFLVSLGLSCYHIAVEQNLLGAPAACMTEMTAVQSVFDVAQQVAVAPSRLPCDQAAITIFGLSLSVYNAMVSLLILIVLVRWSRKRNTCVAECCSSNSCSTNNQNPSR